MSATALELARDALRGSSCWVVGGAVRDELRGAPPPTDLDLVIAGPVAPAARALGRAGHGAAFSLSDEWGAWRVVSGARDWQIDISPLRGGTIEEDLRARDFTINAMARALEGGETIDPLGGAADLRARELRLAAPGALAADPLRALRLVRLACELDLEADAAAREAAREAAGGLRAVASERIYGELRRIVAGERPAEGLRLALALGLCSVFLPELEALRGVEQSRYHHLDVLDHTLAVLERSVELERDGWGALGGEQAPSLREILARPLADELTRAQALRFGAILHDIAKPATREESGDGRVGFPAHDERGAELARAILGRLRAAEAMRAHVALLTRAHLRLGFLVHRAPLERRERYRYLHGCDGAPVDITLLSVADRLATLGEGAERAVERHLALAREIIGEAIAWQRDGPPRPLIRGDQLARALGIAPGPVLGELLGAIAEEAYAGALRSPADAVAFAAARIA